MRSRVLLNLVPLRYCFSLKIMKKLPWLRQSPQYIFFFLYFSSEENSLLVPVWQCSYRHTYMHNNFLFGCILQSARVNFSFVQWKHMFMLAFSFGVAVWYTCFSFWGGFSFLVRNERERRSKKICFPVFGSHGKRFLSLMMRHTIKHT